MIILSVDAKSLRTFSLGKLSIPFNRLTIFTEYLSKGSKDSLFCIHFLLYKGRTLSQFFSLNFILFCRRIWHDGKMMANPAGLGQPQAKGEGNTHRLQVLNKVFLEKISDIMATGEVSSQLSGHGVEITKVTELLCKHLCMIEVRICREKDIG